MKGSLAFLILIHSFFCIAQNGIRIGTVLVSSADKSSVSSIPHIETLSGNQTSITQRINAAILSRFMIVRIDSVQEEDFQWKNVQFTSDIKDSVLYLGFTGIYQGTFTDAISDALYFDLTTGNALKETFLPFHSLFSLNGYFDFLQRHWLPDCSKAYKHAINCAGFEPYCSCYDIDMGFNNQEIVLSLTSDCFFQVVKTCTPYHELSVPLDSLSPYLSDFGRYVLFDTDYIKGSALDKFLFYRRHTAQIPDYHFLVGTVNHKDLIRMALAFTPSQLDAKGYYYIGTSLAHLPLTGTNERNTLTMYEISKGTVLNTFECVFQYTSVVGNTSVRTKFVSAIWKNAQSGRVVEIVWQEIKNTR